MAYSVLICFSAGPYTLRFTLKDTGELGQGSHPHGAMRKVRGKPPPPNFFLCSLVDCIICHYIEIVSWLWVSVSWQIAELACSKAHVESSALYNQVELVHA